jgi:Ca2+-binding RTX toxin-like protein
LGQTIIEGFTSPQNVTYTVTLSSASNQTISVNYATANGTAMGGLDYTATIGTLIFAPGDTSKVINVTILNDFLNEADETFTLTLSSPTNASLGALTTVTTTITDTLTASVTTTLPANVENLTLTGAAAINGTGNAGNNVITGNTGNNILNGGAGIDTLIGGLGNDIYVVDSATDTITELANGGTDTIQSSVTYTIAALVNVENLTLTGAAANGTGNAGNNVITGNTGNNILNGGAGIDTLIGGLGNDIYVVDSATDTITELTNGGTDTIQSSVTYTIAALVNVENLTLTGAAAINGTGNSGNNVIIGNGANNILTGGTGKDTLTGWLGVDRFDYRTLTDSLLSNFDVVTDFNALAGNDLFLVSTARSVFSNVGSVATLDAPGIAAKLTNPFFIANSAARFTFGARTFVAINDATAGFSATTDAIIEVTGLTGTLGLNNFTI